METGVGDVAITASADGNGRFFVCGKQPFGYQFCGPSVFVALRRDKPSHAGQHEKKYPPLLRILRILRMLRILYFAGGDSILHAVVCAKNDR